MSDCLFCKIIAGTIPSHRVYEDDVIVAFLDINPVNPGHTLIVPRRHSENLLDAPAEDVHRTLDVIQRLAPAILAAVGAGAFNLGVNNGAIAGQVVPHLHFHLMPRFNSDGHALWHGKPIAQKDIKAIAEKITRQLSHPERSEGSRDPRSERGDDK